MENHKVGTLFSARKSPGISKAARKSLNKSMQDSLKSKQNGSPNGKKSPQKRKSIVKQNKSVVKVKVSSEEDDEVENDEIIKDEQVATAKESSNNEGQRSEEDMEGEESGDDEGNSSDENMEAEESGGDENESGEESMEAEESGDEGERGEEDMEAEEESGGEGGEHRECSDEDEKGSDDEGNAHDAPEEQSSKAKKDKKAESKLKDYCLDRTIFVGNVKVGMQKKELISLFKTYGAVEAVRFRSIAFENPKLNKTLSLMRNKFHAGRGTCNAYVRFQDKASALKAVKGQNGKEFKGNHLRVTMADKESVTIDNKKTLFVGNLSFNAEDEALWKAFANCGEIESVRIVRDKQTNVSKGFAYINFKSADSVQLAMGMGDITIHKRVLRLSVSEFVKKEKKVSPGNDCSVFTAGFSAGTTKEVVTQAFKEVGPLVKVRLIKDKVTKRATGCAFVTFKNSEDAQKALRTTVKINNSEIDVQVPRKTLKESKQMKSEDSPQKGKRSPQKGKGSPQKGDKFKGKGKQQKAQSGRVEKPWKKNEKRPSGGGSPMKSFQGLKGKAKSGNPMQKGNKGALLRKKMAMRVAAKT